MGRDRVAKAGKWTGGRIPFGYDLDDNSRLIPSERLVPELGMNEADVVRDLFRRMADGSSATKEARRLNAAGVRPPCRYRGKEAKLGTEMWGTTRVYFMLKNATYKGRAVVNSRAGTVERPAPALVTPELWEKANRQLSANQSGAKRNMKKSEYLPRRLVTCGGCCLKMVGQTGGDKDAPKTYYRCQRTWDRSRPEGAKSAHAGQVRADLLESVVWEDCKSFIFNPGDALADAQRQLRDRMTETAGMESQRKALQRQIAGKKEERDRVLTLYRRGHITLDEMEAQKGDVARETAELQEVLNALETQIELAAAFEAHVTGAAALLSQLQEKVHEVERTNDYQTKRQIVELLVDSVTVNKTGKGADSKTELTLRYSFKAPSVFVFRTRRPSGRRCPARRGA